ncbi:MAG TPA: enoyl-CoA hydratase/isomerase family protein [Bryobacteraceae bacterium]
MSLRIEQDRRLRRLTLAAPEKRNILDAALVGELLKEIHEAWENPDTGAILIEADGQIFCGGMDPAAPPPAEFYTLGRSAPKPLVVAVKGPAVSAGMALIANAHVAVAAQGSSFGLVDIREGRWHEGIYQAVAGAIGARRALELSLTGRIFSTSEALSWGLLHSVTPAIELDDRATEIATALANANPDVVRAALAARRKGAAGD